MFRWMLNRLLRPFGGGGTPAPTLPHTCLTGTGSYQTPLTGTGSLTTALTGTGNYTTALTGTAGDCS